MKFKKNYHNMLKIEILFQIFKKKCMKCCTPNKKIKKEIRQVKKI